MNIVVTNLLSSLNRLTIPLAFTIGFVAAIAPYISRGPLFRFYSGNAEACEKYGWFNVLYMNIYQDILKPRTPGVSFEFLNTGIFQSQPFAILLQSLHKY